MKSPVLFGLIALSLAANAALLLKLRPSDAETGRQPSNAIASRDTSAATAGTEAGADAPLPPDAQWSTLPVDDLSALVTRLRSEGFPASVIRAIVAQQVSQRFAERRKELMPPPEDDAFWKYRTGALFADTNPARMAARRALAREQSQLLKELLGPDATTTAGEMEYYTKRQYGDLPRDKIEQVQQIVQDYSDLVAQARAEAQGITLPEDQEKMAFLEAEKRKDLAAVLTPEELTDYELRSSNIASQMRYQLAAFEPTEQEFRTIFEIQKKHEQHLTIVGGLIGGEIMNQRREAEKQVITEVKAVLGEERGAEFERSRDYNYQQLANLAKRFDLPKEAMNDIWKMQQQVEATMRGAGSGSDPAALAGQLAALAEEANGKLNAVFGEKLAAEYKEVAYWLRNLDSMQRAAASRASTPSRPPAAR